MWLRQTPLTILNFKFLHKAAFVVLNTSASLILLISTQLLASNQATSSLQIRMTVPAICKVNNASTHSSPLTTIELTTVDIKNGYVDLPNTYAMQVIANAPAQLHVQLMNYSHLINEALLKSQRAHYTCQQSTNHTLDCRSDVNLSETFNLRLLLSKNAVAGAKITPAEIVMTSCEVNG